MRNCLIGLIAVLAWTASAQAELRRHRVIPSLSMEQAGARLEKELTRRGLKIFAKIDHAKGAKAAGLSLRPTIVYIFGNPKIGTALMAKSQTIGFDLPLKILLWEDANGRRWYGYEHPADIAKRHGIAAGDPVIARIAKALHSIMVAIGPP
jgi:uncharacterized protein (DUF302 family)